MSATQSSVYIYNYPEELLPDILIIDLYYFGEVINRERERGKCVMSGKKKKLQLLRSVTKSDAVISTEHCISGLYICAEVEKDVGKKIQFQFAENSCFSVSNAGKQDVHPGRCVEIHQGAQGQG